MAEDVAAEAGVVQGWQLDPHLCALATENPNDRAC